VSSGRDATPTKKPTSAPAEPLSIESFNPKPTPAEQLSIESFNPKPTYFERIYYINMADRQERRSFMESWLSKQNLPFERVEALTAEHNPCEMLSAKEKRDPAKLKWCHGIQGLRKTHYNIMNNYNTSGLTLVMEDDYMVKNITKLEWAVNTLVPDDWDVVHFDCWGYRPSAVPITKTHKEIEVFRTAHSVPCDAHEEKELDPNNGQCFMCGGTHAMVYRHSSLNKLHEAWKGSPIGIDCGLTNEHIKSYCVNGLETGKFSADRWNTSSIPKRMPSGQ